MLASKVGGYEVAFLGLHDGGSMTLGEGGLLVEELILCDGWRTGGNVAGEVILARTNSLDGSIGQTDIGGGVARNLYIPLHLLQGLLPMALDGAVGTDITNIGMAAVLDMEVGLEHDVLVGIARLTDAAS